MFLKQTQFIILEQNGGTPSLAACSRCNVKFFAPSELLRDGVKAEKYLREKFARHPCMRGGTLVLFANDK
jgi:hypothetical protein